MNRKAKTCKEVSRKFLDQKEKNRSDGESKMATMVAISKIYFVLLLQNWKASWLKSGRKYRGNSKVKNSWNCSDLKSKMATMGAILSVMKFFSWTERPIDFKLGRKYQGDLQIKLAKVI